jgi:hypothetical protein
MAHEGVAHDGVAHDDGMAHDDGVAHDGATARRRELGDVGLELFKLHESVEAFGELQQADTCKGGSD